MQAMAQRPELTGIYSGYGTSIPQIKLDIDREKARTLGIPINSVFQGLQIYLGGLQVNDFNLFGRTYKVMIQAEQDFRKTPESINDIYLRSDDGAMVPMSTISKVEHDDRAGHPAAVQHVPHRGDQRRQRSRHFHRRGAGDHGGPRGKGPSAGLRLRMDRHRLPGKGGGRHTGTDFRHGDDLRVPGAGRPV